MLRLEFCRVLRPATSPQSRQRLPVTLMPLRATTCKVFDVAVVGAGFGGLGAAYSLAEQGARVVLLESLNYPGGCASTFSRDGYRFEAGATLFSGLLPHQLFGRILAKHAPEVCIDYLDPLVELRTPDLRLPVAASREQFIADMIARDPQRAAGITAFFAQQKRVADALWALFDDPSLLPPLDLTVLARHASRVATYLPLLPLVGRPLGQVMRDHGIEPGCALHTFLRGVCQITVQCDAAEAEAPFALAALDYYFRGTGHVRGGIGALAEAMLRAIQAEGGHVQLATRVRSIARDPDGFRLQTRRGEVQAKRVVLNLLPQQARTLLGFEPGTLPKLDKLAARVESGWGAVMLYRVVTPELGADDTAHHLELITDPSAPFEAGNHVFVSMSGARDEGRCPEGQRTLTASTHVAASELRQLDDSARARHIAEIQDRMRSTITGLAPELTKHVVHELTASPRTFERFTGRAEGLVGGIPRRAGLGHYAHLGPFSPVEGVYLAGDSVFPGQSTFATTLGGARIAAAIARER